MTTGAATITCTFSSGVRTCDERACVHGVFYRVWRPDRYDPYYCNRHYHHAHPNNWLLVGPLLQPDAATDEEVTMVEVMCHGFASLGRRVA